MTYYIYMLYIVIYELYIYDLFSEKICSKAFKYSKYEVTIKLENCKKRHQRENCILF